MDVTAALLICALAVSSMYLLPAVNAETGTCTYRETTYHTVSYRVQCGWWHLQFCYRSTTHSHTKTHSVSCGWTNWSCGDCNCNCNGGSQGTLTMTRICKANKCEKNAKSSHVCKTCVRNGGWSSWGPETCGHCHQSYNGGIKVCSHVRTCTNPTPANGGASCVGKHSTTYVKPC